MNGEGTEAGHCLPLALADQWHWQCEDVPRWDITG